MTAPFAQLTHDEIVQWCRQHIATLLDFPIERIPVDAEFDTFGLDSAAAVSLVVELEEWMGTEVSPSLLFEFPTIQLMAAEIVRLRAAAAAEVPA
ncbi:acyl carrier protein [Roseateles sp. DB2]|uniref:acyl carrier protein n=1 Tax=Roseateles sp. DB2 TaxID=3453717 RepID=UPI003EEBEAF8